MDVDISRDCARLPATPLYTLAWLLQVRRTKGKAGDYRKLSKPELITEIRAAMTSGILSQEKIAAAQTFLGEHLDGSYFWKSRSPIVP